MPKTIKNLKTELDIKTDDVEIEDFHDLDSEIENVENEISNEVDSDINSEIENVENEISNEVDSDINSEMEPSEEEKEEDMIEDINNLIDKNEEQPINNLQKKKYVKGIVVGCGALRVRGNPNSKGHEIGRLNKDEVVRISLTESTEKFYAIVTEKYEGFCMKDFIALI